jgi:pyridoxal 5'-phosphate synthase pdxS subunit
VEFGDGSRVLCLDQIDYIDESEVLTMADEENHINKQKFKVPFVCGCRDLGEALVREAVWPVGCGCPSCRVVS